MNKEQYRIYIREYMRKYRARKKAEQEWRVIPKTTSQSSVISTPNQNDILPLYNQILNLLILQQLQIFYFTLFYINNVKQGVNNEELMEIIKTTQNVVNPILQTNLPEFNTKDVKHVKLNTDINALMNLSKELTNKILSQLDTTQKFYNKSVKFYNKTVKLNAEDVKLNDSALEREERKEEEVSPLQENEDEIIIAELLTSENEENILPADKKEKEKEKIPPHTPPIKEKEKEKNNTPLQEEEKKEEKEINKSKILTNFDLLNLTEASSENDTSNSEEAKKFKKIFEGSLGEEESKKILESLDEFYAVNFSPKSREIAKKIKRIEKAREVERAPYESIRKLFNEVCAGVFPQVEFLTEARKEKVKQAWRLLKDLNKFKELFEKAKKSPWLTGENPGGWRADFEWILANAHKILEGYYDERLPEGYEEWMEELTIAELKKYTSEEYLRVFKDILITEENLKEGKILAKKLKDGCDLVSGEVEYVFDEVGYKEEIERLEKFKQKHRIENVVDFSKRYQAYKYVLEKKLKKAKEMGLYDQYNTGIYDKYLS